MGIFFGIFMICAAIACGIMGALHYLFTRSIPYALAGAAVVLLIAGILLLRAKPKAQRVRRTRARSRVLPPEESEADAPRFAYVGFRVAGVTYSNDDGTKRQVILRALFFQDPPYYIEDTQPTVEIKRSVFNGETALPVFVNGYQIGFVPKDKIPAVLAALDHNGWIDDYRVSGGGQTPEGERINFGCMISIKYRP